MDEDKKHQPQEAEDAVMQQSYPSPIVDSADAQYYQQLASHRDHEAQIEQQAGHPEHHGLPAISEHQHQHQHQHQGQQHEDHGLHALQGLQEQPPPPQHHSRPSVSTDSAEELQLAAQLTQGLAPMMAAAQMGPVQDQTQEQQRGLTQQDADVPPQSEPNLQEQLEASLQNHEREMQSREHALQNHELQSVLPPAGRPQQHQHQHQQHPYQQTLPPHPFQDHIGGPGAAGQYQLPDATPPRKRSKVSRACDECRRKKIKCDAQVDKVSEMSEQPCSNCRRSNAQCLFSRIPQKRGPSKGYIKELADRINTIEGKLNTSVESLDSIARRSSSDAFASPGVGGDESRKRPFSSISGDAYHTPSPARMQGIITTEHRPILPLIHPDYRSLQPANPSDLSPRPAALMHFPAGPSDDGIGQSQPDSVMAGISQNGLPQGSSQQTDQLPEIEDAAFDRYLEAIHPTFPVLASTKARVQSLLWQSPLALQNAFYNAFFAMVAPFLPGGSGAQMTGDACAACRLLSEWETARRPRSVVTDLVRLQTLIMAVIAADCQGTASLKGELGGPSKAEILGRAVGLGYSMKLHLRVVDHDASPELDPNSDDNVALRAWWVLVMLDRWNAVGTATPTFINNDGVVVQPGLQHIVGDVVFTLIRTSWVLGHIVPVVLTPPIDPSPSAAPVLGSSMAVVAADLLRWSIPASVLTPSPPSDPTTTLHHDNDTTNNNSSSSSSSNKNNTLPLLAYWHVRLLADLLSPPDRPARGPNILQATRNLVVLLARNHDLLTPLTHHFMVLAALGLLDLAGAAAGAGREVAELAAAVLEFSLAPSMWNAAVREWLGGKIAPGGVGTGTAGLAGGGDVDGGGGDVDGGVQGQAEQQSQQGQQGELDVAGGSAAMTTTTTPSSQPQQNLQRLADVATAAETTTAAAAAAAPGDGVAAAGAEQVDAMKQVPLAPAAGTDAAGITATGSGGGREAAQAEETHGAGAPQADAHPQAREQTQAQIHAQAQAQPVDVRAILREGYLTCFTDLIQA
ncbi:hypothetical protein VTK26DRAFT_6255 [Humicola hyalothermophila]